MNAALSTMWQASLWLCFSLVAVSLGRRLLRRHASARYLLWLAVPLVLLAQALPGPAAPSAEAWRWQPLSAPVNFIAAPQPSHSPWAPTPATLLLGAWALGSTLLLAVLALQHAHYCRRLRRHPDGRSWIAPAGHSAATLGLLMPKPVWPVDCAVRYSPQEQALIRAHESIHIARHDNAWALLAVLLLAWQWANPLAWWAWRAWRADQESACDAAVLRRHPEAIATYAHALAASSVEASSPLTATAATHPLLARLTMLPHHIRLSPSRCRAVQAATLAGACTAAALAWASQPAAPPVPAMAATPLPHPAPSPTWRVSAKPVASPGAAAPVPPAAACVPAASQAVPASPRPSAAPAIPSRAQPPATPLPPLAAPPAAPPAVPAVPVPPPPAPSISPNTSGANAGEPLPASRPGVLFEVHVADAAPMRLITALHEKAMLQRRQSPGATDLTLTLEAHPGETGLHVQAELRQCGSAASGGGPVVRDAVLRPDDALTLQGREESEDACRIRVTARPYALPVQAHAVFLGR